LVPWEFETPYLRENRRKFFLEVGEECQTFIDSVRRQHTTYDTVGIDTRHFLNVFVEIAIVSANFVFLEGKK